MGIAAGQVAWVPLCRGDLRLGRVACVACVVGRVAWVAPCHGDCCWACRGCGAVPWGLLVGVSRGWRRVLGIADQGVVWVAPCLRDC